MGTFIIFISSLFNNKMSHIGPNCILGFNTSLYFDLVRIGTIGDGSCFLHACIYSMYKKYRHLNNIQKSKLITKVRRLMADKITMTDWKTIGCGEVAKNDFLIYLRKLIENLYTTIDTDFICSFLNKNFSLDNKVDGKLGIIVDQAITLAYEQFVDNIRSSTFWIDISMIEIISDILDRDIHILEDTTGQPYRFGGKSHIKHRLSLVVLWVDRSHYEAVGKVVDDIIITEFGPRDPLIIKINRSI